MQENGKIQGLNARQNGLEQRIIKVAMIDICAHINAPYSRQLACAMQFLDGAIREEHRKRKQSEQPRRILTMRAAGGIVRGPRELAGNFVVPPLGHGSGELHGLHGGALRIHISDSLLEVDDPVREGPLEGRLVLDVKTFSA